MKSQRALFEHLYYTEQDAVRRVVRKTLFDPAFQEDAVALTFVRLWKKMEAGPVETPERLLPIIARGCALDLYRERKRRLHVETPIGLLPELAAMEERLYAEGRRPLPTTLWTFPTDFDSAVRDLETDGRHAFILTELRGLNSRSAAELLDTSHDTVCRRADAARSTVRKELF